MSMLASVQQILDPLFPGLLGIELSEVGPERVVASMQVRPELCTTGSVLHGGAIMAFADTLGAVATFANLPKGARTTTIESKTNFLRAVREGAVTALTRPLHKGRTLIVLETELAGEDGALVAKVTQSQAFQYP